MGPVGQSPISSTLHTPELLNGLHHRTALEQPDSLLTSHRSLQMVVIGVSRMMSNQNIRLRFQNSLLNELQQLQMRNRVYLKIQETPLILMADTQELSR